MAIFNSKLLVYQRLIYNVQWSWYISSNKKSPLRTPNCGRKRPIWLSGSPGQGPWATFRWGSDRHWWWETENHGDGENLGPMDPHMLVSFDLNLFLLRDIVIHLEWDPNYEPMELRDIGMPHVCLSENRLIGDRFRPMLSNFILCFCVYVEVVVYHRFSTVPRYTILDSISHRWLNIPSNPMIS